MLPLLIHILGLATVCALALPTVLHGGAPAEDVTNRSDATVQEWNPPAAGGSHATAQERACEPATGRLDAYATLSDRAGRYHLTLVADAGATDSAEADISASDSGSAARPVASGLLTLRSQGPQGQQKGNPEFPAAPSTSLYGFTDIDLVSVGAHRVGDPGSEDPLEPGVLVLEREEYGRRVITLRLGSLANRRDLVRYDGAYTVLRVEEISKGGFAGSWRSGGGLDLSVTTGYFCAREVP